MPSASMQVRTNIATQTAHREMRQLSSAKTNAAHRLSSGFRINSAADDAAGLAITESMTSQIRGLDQAATNAQDGMSLLQTAEGAMEGIGDMLQRIRELLVQAANDTNVESNRAQIDLEIQSLLDGIDDMALRAEYNSMALINGLFSNNRNTPGHNVFPQPFPATGDREMHFQIGANSLQNMFVGIGGMTTHHLGLRHTPSPTSELRLTTGYKRNMAGSPLDANGNVIPPGDLIRPPIGHPDHDDWTDPRVFHDHHSISRQIAYMDEALNYLNTERAKLGSVRVRLEHTRQANTVSSDNLSAARSRVRDTDMAREMMDFTQINVLFQAANAMIAHGNRLPETVLQLLQ